METNKEVKFKIHKRTRLKLLFGLVSSLLLGLIPVLWADNLEFGKGKMAILLVGAVSCGLFVFTVYSLYKLHKSKYIGVRLTSEGIEGGCVKIGTPSFYAQRSNFPKLGLCYFLEFL